MVTHQRNCYFWAFVVMMSEEFNNFALRTTCEQKM